MQITVSGHHVEVTPALREYVNNKLAKLQRHFDNITNTDVTLSVEKLVQKAEATVHVAGADLFATCESEDMYAAGIFSAENNLSLKYLTSSISPVYLPPCTDSILVELLPRTGIK